jgi:hypothetical protein
MATDLVTIATTAVLSQFLGPSAKHFGEMMLERGKQVGTKALDLLAAVGRKPQAVEPKVLLPLVQAAALETDESLAGKWAALLANAADPAQRVMVQPGFAEVLRQLTPVQAEVLVQMYAQDKENQGRAYSAPETLLVGGMAKRLGLPEPEFALCVDNLLRLRLCAVLDGPHQMGPFKVPATPTSYLNPTVFGREFVRACTPPTA